MIALLCYFGGINNNLHSYTKIKIVFIFVIRDLDPFFLTVPSSVDRCQFYNYYKSCWFEVVFSYITSPTSPDVV